MGGWVGFYLEGVGVGGWDELCVVFREEEEEEVGELGVGEGETFFGRVEEGLGGWVGGWVGGWLSG